MIRVDIKDAHLVVDAVGQKIRLAKQRGVLSAAQRLVQVIKTEIVPGENPPPVDQGAYLAGWDAEPTADGAAVFNTAPHAPIIEEGGRPGFQIGRAMINALAEWVTRKGLLGRGAGSIQERAQGQEARNMAWAIATKMKQRGMFVRDGQRGLHVAQKAKKRAFKIIEEEIRAELQEALK